MGLFNTLVDEAIRNQGELTALRPVVEKEILHHDILRELSHADLLHLWDIAWLTQSSIEPAYELLALKLADHGESEDIFFKRADERLELLTNDEQQQRDFIFEMSRFIPPDRKRSFHDVLPPQ